jgi:16S rRNA (guanine527-N7)-methyltransferase
MTPADDAESIANRLNEQLLAAGLKPINEETTAKFAEYLALLLRWNARMNLTAIRNPQGILSRHFVESIACAQALPTGIVTLLDFGSGAGFPGIPIALCRPEINVTLAESQSKKAAFLREVLRSLKLGSRVFGGRGETIEERFDCVTLRAVDRMEQAVAAASKLIRVGGWLAVFTTQANLAVLEAAGGALQWGTLIPMPGSERRVLILASKIEQTA